MSITPLEQILNAKLATKIKTNSTYLKAFTHKSYSNENDLDFSYERLEFFGDAILGQRIAEFLFTRFPEMDEGDLTSLRSKVVRQETLAAAATAFNLADFLFLGNGEKNTGGQQRTSILSDIFESFIAAVYLDLGMVAVDKILNLSLYEWIANNSFDHMIDYKTRLQEYAQNEKRDPITYKLIRQEKKQNQNIFIIGVYLDELLMGQGEGVNKKTAEQAAAKAALDKLSPMIDKNN